MVEISISVRGGQCGDMELARCCLLNAGVDLERIVEKVQRAKASLIVYERSASKAAALVRAVKAARMRGLSVTAKRVASTDWTSRWKKYFRPFNITPLVRVVPQWLHNSRVPAGLIPVYLDTTFAFGSGMHATTQLVARFMHRQRAHIGSFFDIGTGSGILVLIARAYGVRDIWAIDVDPVSVSTARRNCVLNGFRPKHLSVADFGKFSPRKKFDFVAANLLTDDLIRLQSRLSSVVSAGGFLAVSGIFQDNYSLFCDKFIVRGLRKVRAARRKGWYAVLFRKDGVSGNEKD
jgi:ribosomal protein L11 methyltransferase